VRVGAGPGDPRAGTGLAGQLRRLGNRACHGIVSDFPILGGPLQSTGVATAGSADPTACGEQGRMLGGRWRVGYITFYDHKTAASGCRAWSTFYRGRIPDSATVGPRGVPGPQRKADSSKLASLVPSAARVLRLCPRARPPAASSRAPPSPRPGRAGARPSRPPPLAVRRECASRA